MSQVTQEWVARFSSQGSNADYGRTLAIDRNGNIIVAGNAFNGLTTIKYSTSGSIVWSKIYGNSSTYAQVYSLSIDTLNNVYITGWVRDIDNTQDMLTLKYDSNGTQKWQSIYEWNILSDNIGISIKTIDSEFLYVCCESDINANYDCSLVKYDQLTGDTVWVRKYSDLSPIDMAVDNWGNTFITGNFQGFRTIKYDIGGNLKWVANTTQAGDAHSICIDKQGNVYVTGDVFDHALDCITVKYDSTGITKWIKKFDGSGQYDNSYSVTTDDSSNVFICGYSEDASYNKAFLVVKYSTLGIQQWVASFNTAHEDQAWRILTDRSGSSYVTGWADYSFCTIKYSPNGVLSWQRSYNYNGSSSSATSIAFDSIGNVFVSGTSNSNQTGNDIATIKYSQPIGIAQISQNIPSDFSLLQNYPNPFNPVTNIKFDIPQRSIVKISIYDILGKDISVLVNEELNPGTFEVNWDASNFPSGVYFYKIVTDDFTESKKMVLIK